jgi:phosphatidylglycerophosphatase A
MEINLKWLPGFQMCSVMQLYLERLKFTKRQSNLIACIIFQVVFVSNAIKLLVNNNGSIDSTLINIDLITGYFIYDTINILNQDF